MSERRAAGTNSERNRIRPPLPLERPATYMSADSAAILLR